jgi:hypothetical protein
VRSVEDQVNATNKQYAEDNNIAESKGSVATRRVTTWHRPYRFHPYGIDYWDVTGTCGVFSPRAAWMVPRRVFETKDRKTLYDWYKNHPPKYRHAVRLSRLVQTYFPMNLESERRKLLESFPKHLDQDRWAPPQKAAADQIEMLTSKL